MTFRNANAPATLSRRSLLSAASAFSVLSLSQWPTGAFAAGMDIDAFTLLSQKLVQQDRLSSDIAGNMLSAFEDISASDRLAKLAQGDADTEIANSVVSAWYTGESPNPDDLQVLTYTDALIWDAIDYTKPMAYCGGAMGYWADPPEV